MYIKELNTNYKSHLSTLDRFENKRGCKRGKRGRIAKNFLAACIHYSVNIALFRVLLLKASKGPHFDVIAPYSQ
jgi:hypothetical protein